MAAGLTLGTAAAVVSVDALWLMHQSARGVPGEFQTIDMHAVMEDIISLKGLLIAGLVFLFVFAVAKTWRGKLGE